MCQAGCFVYCPKVKNHMTELMNQGRQSDVWNGVRFFLEIFNSWPRLDGRSIFFRHYLLPHDTDMRLCKRGQRSCTGIDSGIHSVWLVSVYNV